MRNAEKKKYIYNINRGVDIILEDISFCFSSEAIAHVTRKEDMYNVSTPRTVHASGLTFFDVEDVHAILPKVV